MLGIVVSGHGHFASGLVSALKLLAGEPDAVAVADFEAQDSIEILENKLKAAIDTLGETDGIMIMTDLQGGSPFNVSIRLAMTDERLEVVTGTNLPMLVEAYMTRPMYAGVAEFAEAIANTGKLQVSRFVKELSAGSDDDDDEIELD